MKLLIGIFNFPVKSCFIKIVLQSTTREIMYGKLKPYGDITRLFIIPYTLCKMLFSSSNVRI